MAIPNSLVPCSDCGHNVKIITGKADVAICDHCGGVMMTAMGTTFSSGKVTTQQHYNRPIIPLESLLTLKKVEYKVVGIAQMQENGKPYKWTEYCLYNPEVGFRTLSEYKGAFNLVTSINTSTNPVELTESKIFATYNGKKYPLYNKYDITLKYATGEFNYNISRLPGTHSWEFVNPPQLLIYHEKGVEKEYFTAEYVSHKEIIKSLGKHIPQGDFVNPTKTLWGNMKPKSLFMAFFVFFASTFIMAFIQQKLKPEEVIFSKEFQYNPFDSVGKNTPIISPSFELSGLGSNLTAEIEADVSNDWFSLGFELVNESNNESRSFENGVEYYSGYTDGESWSEGSHTNEVNITRIKPGKYHLVILPYMSNGVSAVKGSVRIVKNQMYFSNYLLVLILGFIFPLIYMYANYVLDKKRWYYSDYSQYTYDDE